MKKKELSKVIVIGSLAVLLAIAIPLAGGCAPQSAEPEGETPTGEVSTYTLRVQVGFGPPETDALIRPYFRKIEAASDGQLKFEIYTVGELCPDDMMMESLMAGTVDLAQQTGAHAAVPLDISPFDSASPFAWSSAMELTTLWYEKGMREIFTEAYEEMGNIKWIGYFPTDPTHIITKEPVYHLEDLNGLKLDAMANVAEVLDQFGVTSVALPREELYLSGQTGIIDGLADMGATEAHANSFDEVFPYFLDNPINGAWLCWWLINEDTWNSLPAHLQDVLVTGLKAGALDALIYYYEGEAASRKYFTVTHMPAEEWNQLREYALSQWDSYAEASPRAAELVQIIRDYNAEVESTKWWR